MKKLIQNKGTIILCAMSLLSGCSVYKEGVAEVDFAEAKHIPCGFSCPMPNGMVEVIRGGDASWLIKGETSHD